MNYCNVTDNETKFLIHFLRADLRNCLTLGYALRTHTRLYSDRPSSALI